MLMFYSDTSSQGNEYNNFGQICHNPPVPVPAPTPAQVLVPTRKTRMVWTEELHEQFLAALDKIGHDDATPKRILEVMNIPGITRENIASHLQKYRASLQKNSNKNPPAKSASSSAEFSSPLQIRPLFRSAPVGTPNLKFSQSERKYLRKIFGIESPFPDRAYTSTNPPQPPPCKRVLLHSL